MSRSFTKSINSTTSDYLTISKDPSASNQVTGVFWANECLRKIFKLRNWNFTRKKTTISTVASQQFYVLPGDIERLKEIKLVIGGTTYTPEEVSAPEIWQGLNITTYNGDVTQKWFFDAEDTKQLGLYPIPSSSGNTITVYYQYRIFDLGDTFNADYTTGTITGTNGTNTITGAGTAWTPGMVGQFIQPNNTGFWYEITGQTATTLTLRYNLTKTVTAGTAYTISECIPLPDGFEDLPLYYALYNYGASKENDKLYKMYKAEYEEGLKSLIARDERTARGELLKKDPLAVLQKSGVLDPNKYPSNIT
ncbi:MAG: hypothetical protein NVSMB66_6160 [Candidatus Doudnabacteria bacterium]